MPKDHGYTSPSPFTHLFLCNINGSAAAMEPSFGNAIALHSPSWGGGRRGGQRYYTAHRSSSRITESPIFCWASDENLHAESPEYYLCSTASSCKRNDYPNNLIELKVNLKNKLRG
ncbi:hypothetical protein O6H91_23G007200 [Diphasiastrum complanatum]|uniref:Uncharacterized protein n=1 Tax=Diphasiastrum complanatum TaxID=34168 RepID=A0ACC2A8A5_DIPCM|nr:hypothetical protein O6H91_23G007200 [Diphasiastrum complanatum]